MEIIEIKSEDLNRIEPLWQELNSMHHDISTHFKNHFATMDFQVRLKKLLAKENLVAYGAMDGKNIVGYCLATASMQIGEIDSLYLKPEYRRTGLGKRLCQKALDWLSSKRCHEIRVSIAEGNEQAMEFYETLGFKERFHVMQLKHS